MKNRSSGTAEGVAYMRFYESQRPESQQICNDNMAYDFSAWWVKVLAIICKPIPLKMMDNALERKGKGISGYMAVRTRFFDDYVKESIQNGARQYVILGAGLDSRPYRFAQQMIDVKVFEIDHPLSQKVKKQRVLKLFGNFPAHVQYVSVDFNQEDLFTKLLDAGYDPALKTAFTLEGVTMYLDEQSVKDMLSFIYQYSGKGSSVVFDYVYKDVLDGRMNSSIVSHMNSLKFIFHEPIVFGIEMGEVEGFIQRIGFEEAKEYAPQMLYDLYLKAQVPNRSISEVYAIAKGCKK